MTEIYFNDEGEMKKVSHREAIKQIEDNRFYDVSGVKDNRVRSFQFKGEIVKDIITYLTKDSGEIFINPCQKDSKINLREEKTTGPRQS